MPLVFIMTTTDNKEIADKLAKEMVGQKLAACVQIEPIKSFYRWQEMICEDEEFRLMIKTTTSKSEAVKAYLQANHNYNLPEYVVVPVMESSAAYQQWVEKETE